VHNPFGAVHVVCMSPSPAIRDPYCGRAPSDIPDVVDGAEDEGVSPDVFAQQDGTFNPQTGEFACLACYIDLGMPTTAAGWNAGQSVPQPTNV